MKRRLAVALLATTALTAPTEAKAGPVVPMSSLSDFGIQPKTFTKYYLCYPKEVG